MIPNIITTFRLLLVPTFAYLMLIADNIWAAAALFLISGLSDVIDGIIARKCNMITDTGKVYDPLVDKLMQITVLLALAAKGFIPVWAIIIIIAKEIAMIVAALVLYIKQIIVHSKWYGKMSTVVFYAVILILVLWRNIPFFVQTGLLVILIGTMLFSAVAYVTQLPKFKDENQKA